MQVAALAGAALGAAVKELLPFVIKTTKATRPEGSDQAEHKAYEPCALL